MCLGQLHVHSDLTAALGCGFLRSKGVHLFGTAFVSFVLLFQLEEFVSYGIELSEFLSVRFMYVPVACV